MTRRTGLAVAALTASMTVAFVASCSAGQITQTDQQVTVIPGVNADATVSPPPSRVAVRNLHIVYPGSQGYAVGSDAPVDVRIFNDTPQPVTVKVSSPDATSVRLASGPRSASPSASPSGSPSASPSVSRSGSPSRSPSGSPSVSRSGSPSASASPSSSGSPSASTPPRPSAAPAGPAEFTIAPSSFVVLAPGASRQLVLVGLKEALHPGESVRLVFDFGNNAVLTVDAPVVPPLTPLPRSPLDVEPGEG
jgi:hypothetical protein